MRCCLPHRSHALLSGSWHTFKCIACGVCVKECPRTLAIAEKEESPQSRQWEEVIAAVAKDKGEPMKSITRSSFAILTEQHYELRPVKRGYNMRTLYVNVGTRTIAEKPVSETMKAKFVGGKGFGLKLLWDATKPTTKWNDPENEIVIAMGPICGNTNYPGSGKSLVVSLSPLTDIPIDSNVGGFFGPYLGSPASMHSNSRERRTVRPFCSLTATKGSSSCWKLLPICPPTRTFLQRYSRMPLRAMRRICSMSR